MEKKGKENRTSTNSIKVVLTNSCYNFGFFDSLPAFTSCGFGWMGKNIF
jgi:hypothetical protein